MWGVAWGREVSFLQKILVLSLGSNESQMVPGCDYFIRSVEQTLELSPAVILAQIWLAKRRKSAAS